MMLSEERLEEIQERCKAATPGPWNVNHVPFDRFLKEEGWEIRAEGCCAVLAIIDYNLSHFGYADKDAEFMAAAREDIPALLAEVDRLRDRDHKYHRRLLSELHKVRRQGTGPDTLYFSDGLQTSVEILMDLEAAGLFVRVGEGPGGHVMGRLTDEGRRMMGGGE